MLEIAAGFLIAVGALILIGEFRQGLFEVGAQERANKRWQEQLPLILEAQAKERARSAEDRRLSKLARELE
jgi:hypothetical protein